MTCAFRFSTGRLWQKFVGWLNFRGRNTYPALSAYAKCLHSCLPTVRWLRRVLNQFYRVPVGNTAFLSIRHICGCIGAFEINAFSSGSSETSLVTNGALSPSLCKVNSFVFLYHLPVSARYPVADQHIFTIALHPTSDVSGFSRCDHPLYLQKKGVFRGCLRWYARRHIINVILSVLPYRNLVPSHEVWCDE